LHMPSLHQPFRGKSGRKAFYEKKDGQKENNNKRKCSLTSAKKKERRLVPESGRLQLTDEKSLQKKR